MVTKVLKKKILFEELAGMSYQGITGRKSTSLNDLLKHYHKEFEKIPQISIECEDISSQTARFIQKQILTNQEK